MERTITDLPADRPAWRTTASGMRTVEAFSRAVELAALGPAHGPNPRVGCVITDPYGTVLGEGYHQGAGTAHAEVAALRDLRERGHNAVGAFAYVTLEPCSHTGRTGPCTQALHDAGIGALRYAVEDPNPEAAGGGALLRDGGMDALFVPNEAAEKLNERWLAAMRRSRPYVIAKWGVTLDGRTAAADGTSFWITGDESRDHAHTVRGEVDAIVVGTNTVLIDNPSLSARPGGHETGHQPLRVVMGLRDTRSTVTAPGRPATATEPAQPGDGQALKVWRDDNVVAVHTHDPAEVLEELQRREMRTVLIEGGARVTTAFLAAGLVDEIHVYVAPVILGSGTTAVGDLGITTMNRALRGQDVSTRQLGADTLVIAHVAKGT
ncbi:bifunctional diaminohydroxyphosphoribosylaminopyrimidine deaminase/5-amino-6-(5-phosphoribosylamino)uracil reductase RibD [Demequina aurantiaca]|uniref:bifunctional diaminohydroxyphosphoribosylaminopyrimidine deaminase/5-amino-6-(5-phosphoribosylamino)uracil reductase RibD n=1 Tax=Demequina aurantiaca TaxID=676200 RepID=UPI003D357EB1